LSMLLAQSCLQDDAAGVRSTLMDWSARSALVGDSTDVATEEESGGEEDGDTSDVCGGSSPTSSLLLLLLLS